MNVRELGSDDMDWIVLAKDVDQQMGPANFRFHEILGNSCVTTQVQISRRAQLHGVSYPKIYIYNKTVVCIELAKYKV